MLSMLVVDDEYLVRSGIKETINWQDYNISILGDVSDGEQGLELAMKYKPDIILTDIRMPFMDGLEFMSRIRDNGLDSSIIVLSGYEEFNYVKTAMQNGAEAYLLKPIDNQQLIETVEKVANKIREKRKSKQYLEKFKNELPVLRKQFVKDMISGDLTSWEEILDKIRFLELSIEFSNNLVIVIRLDEYDTLLKLQNPAEFKRFKEELQKCINDNLLQNSDYCGIAAEESDAVWVVLLHIAKNDDKEVENVRKCCKEIIDTLSRNFRQQISIGISRVYDDLGKLSLAYKEAYAALDYKIIPGNSSVGYFGDRELIGYRREIKDAIKYIKDNFNKDISVETASRELYISPSYLMFLFRKELNKTFNECLTDYRIYKAKELMKNTRYKIYEISESVGYDDEKYFSQVFKKVTGMSPSEYIRSFSRG
ncbi:MAG TPA: response regulator [Clostridiaceae bacterium]|nr:response regulator [Clostridiaceae bacterium]